MVTNELKQLILQRFNKNYSELFKSVYKTELNLSANSEIKLAYDKLVNAYFSSLVNFYKFKPTGTYMEELTFLTFDPQLKTCIDEYLDLTGDETLVRFLHVYGYCAEELGEQILDSKNNIIQKGIKGYFEKIDNCSTAMYKKLEKDIKEGNFWWLKNCATTLRRQLYEDIIIINKARLSSLFDTYFDRKVDFMAEFVNAIDGGRPLIDELDETMEKRYGAKPYFTWWREYDNGRKLMNFSEDQPNINVYSFITYQKESISIVTEDDHHYL